MIRFAFVGLALMLLSAPRLGAQDASQMPKPVQEHTWMKQLVGEWESEMEASMGPGTDPIKCKGKEKGRMHGDFFMIAESEGDMMGMPVKSVFTLGYDADKKKYVGTWVDNCAPTLWKYEGTVDATGKVLTLETEGPNMMAPGKTAKYREVITLVNPDEKTFTSSMQGEDGKWTTFVKATYKRKK